MDQTPSENSAQCSREISVADKQSSVGNKLAKGEKISTKGSQRMQCQEEDTPKKRASSEDQEFENAQKQLVELQQREIDLRQTLKSVRKDHDKELKSLRQCCDAEKSELMRQVCHT